MTLPKKEEESSPWATAEVPFPSYPEEDWVDIHTLQVDSTLPVPQRIQSLLEQMPQPFCCRCGEFKIQLSFREDAPTLSQLIEKLEELEDSAFSL